jgi:hypothetical protein
MLLKYERSTGENTFGERGLRQRFFWIVGEALMALFQVLETRDALVKTL